MLSFELLPEAIAELNSAVGAGAPSSVPARWLLAKAHLYAREPDRAIELLAPLEADWGSQYEVMEGLGLAHYFKKDFARTVSYLEKAIALKAPDTSVLNALGDSYQELGRMKEAKSVFERSLALNPDQEAVVDTDMTGIPQGEEEF